MEVLNKLFTKLFIITILNLSNILVSSPNTTHMEEVVWSTQHQSGSAKTILWLPG